MTFAAAMDAGFSSTLIDIQYRKQLSQIQEEPNAVIPSVDIDGKIAQKSAVAIQALNNNSQKLVNWLLSSDQVKKENLCSTTVRLLEVRRVFAAKTTPIHVPINYNIIDSRIVAPQMPTIVAAS